MDTDKVKRHLLGSVLLDDGERVRQLVERHGLSFHGNLDDGLRPLVIAICNKYTEIAIYLIEAGAKMALEHDNTATALHFAASSQEQEVVELLLRNGANPRRREALGSTPLHVASLGDSVEIVRILLSNGASVNATNNRGITALHCAAIRDNEDIAQVLLDNEANYNIAGGNGMKPIHHAIANGNREIVSKLFKAGYNADDFERETSCPLHQAARLDHRGIVELFLINNCNSDKLNHLNETALHQAVKFCKVKSVILLLNWLIDVGLVDRYGKTALEMASNRWRMSVLIRERRIADGTYNSDDAPNPGRVWWGLVMVIRKHIVKLVAADLPIRARQLGNILDLARMAQYREAGETLTGRAASVIYRNRVFLIREELLAYYWACKREVDNINAAIVNEFHSLSLLLDKSTGYAHIANEPLMDSLKRAPLVKYRQMIRNKIMRDKILFKRAQRAILGLGSLPRVDWLPPEVRAIIVRLLDIADLVNLGRLIKP